MTESERKILMLCYGNPGRLDDGLGAAFAEAMEQMAPPGVDISADYQLTVEDAADVAQHDYVIFVDAAVDGPEPFFFRKITAQADTSFTTHSVEPEALLALANELFSAKTEAYALGIRGYEYNEFGESLSSAAQNNLAAALQFMLPVVKKRNFSEVATNWEN